MEPRDTYLAVWPGRTALERAVDLTERIAWLYDAHSSSMYRLAVFLTGSVEDAEDVVSDVFAKLFDKPGMLRPDVDAKAYLLCAARNGAYSVLRRRKRCRGVSDSVLEYLSRAEFDQAFETRLGAAEIMKSIALLPTEQREVVLLKAIEQLTFQEIADMSGASINTIVSRYRSAIASVRHSLEEV